MTWNGLQSSSKQRSTTEIHTGDSTGLLGVRLINLSDLQIMRRNLWRKISESERDMLESDLSQESSDMEEIGEVLPIIDPYDGEPLASSSDEEGGARRENRQADEDGILYKDAHSLLLGNYIGFGELAFTPGMLPALHYEGFQARTSTD